MGQGVKPADAYYLPERLRPALAEPWGPVVDTAALALMLQDDDVIIAVGDIVSMTLHELGLAPRVFICDYKTQRQDDDPELIRTLGSWGDHEIRVDNPAASVTAAAWDAVIEGLRQEGITRIVVDGEEDLLGLPCFLEAPDDAIVLYGMPGRGVVVCRVTPDLRARVRQLVRSLDQ